ncbi:MAG: hypothetical protein IPL79_08460 [Myxococcales bacterium]|nr:hypothetical protein [Myxococcales bacterium]
MTADALGLVAHVTPEQFEQWRSIGLRLDRQGRFWHQDGLVEHRRLQLALLRWLARRDDGRYIVRLDESRYAYVDVEDAPLRVVSFRVEHDAPIIRLDDESEEHLASASLTTPDGAQIYARVRGGTLWARFLSGAQQTLAEHLRGEHDQFALVIGPQAWPIRSGEVA